MNTPTGNPVDFFLDKIQHEGLEIFSRVMGPDVGRRTRIRVWAFPKKSVLIGKEYESGEGNWRDHKGTYIWFNGSDWRRIQRELDGLSGTLQSKSVADDPGEA